MLCAPLALAGLALAVSGASGRTPFIAVTLLTESNAPQPGRSFLIGLQMIPKPGWHGYWSNAGESGLAPVVKWSVPTGVHFGPLEHPAPTLMQVMGLTSYVHSGPHILLSRVRLDPGVPIGKALPIVANISLAACSDRLCVPERKTLLVQLKAGGGEAATDAASLRQALANEPKPLAAGTFEVRSGTIILKVPFSAHLEPQRVRFFPDVNGYWDARKVRVISQRPLRIAGAAKSTPPREFSGVLSDGSSAYQITFRSR